MQVNRNYYEYDRTLVNGVEVSKRISALTNFKLNEELDSSIFFVQNNTNPNLVNPVSSIIRYEPQAGSDVNRVWYNPYSSYGTLQSGENSINPSISELFDDKQKIRMALCRYGAGIKQNDRIGYSATYVPSGLNYTFPLISNNYKKIIVTVLLFCNRIKYGNTTTNTYTVSPYGYNDNITAKVADGTYPDIVTAKLYNPIIGINCYISYFDDSTSSWKKLDEFEGILFDVTHKKKNLYYAHNLLFGFDTSGAVGDSTLPIGNVISITRTSASTGTGSYFKNFNIYNGRDVPYWKGSIPPFELNDWEEGRIKTVLNTDNKYKSDDLRYWQMYDYSVGNTKYTIIHCCITIEGVKRYIASLGLFFNTKSLSELHTDLSDLDNLPDYVHMPEVTPNGFTTGNYFSGREIGKSSSPNKNWNSTTDSTIKVDADSSDGNDVEDLQFAQLNGSANNFIKSYILSYDELNSLAENFNNDNPANPIPVGANPFANIISLKQYPFDISLPMVSMWRTEGIILDKWNTGVAGKRLVSQNMLRQIGSYKIEKKYNSFLDYEPFTTAEIYVPMCGRAKLPLNYIMGKTIIVYFASDLENGGCKAIVKCDEISAELSGTFSEDVSLTAENAGIKKLEMAYAGSGFLASSVGAGVSVVKGDATGMIYSAINGFKSVVDMFSVENGNYSVIKGESTPKVNFNNVSKCYIKISRPIIELPENYGRVNGFVVNKKLNLSNLNGYTICNNVDVNGLYCTENEKEMLKGIMESGFYI